MTSQFPIGISPGLARKGLGKHFAKRPVKAGIVSDDEIGRIDQRLEGLYVDHLTFDHRVGNAGQLGDIRRNGHTRLLQSAIIASKVNAMIPISMISSLR